MIFRYGNYTHAQDEVSVSMTQDVIRNDRGRRQYIRKTLEISGILHGDTPAELTQKLHQLDAAYAVDGRDATLLLNDAVTPTHHRLVNAQSVSGVRVVRPPSFPDGGGTEYTTYRSYDVVLQADFLVLNADNAIVSFNETVAVIGTGGPRRVWHEVLAGDPIPQITNSKTVIRVVQTGEVVGLFGRVPTPAPIFPEWLDHPASSVTRHSPMREWGRLINWRTSWNYQMVRGSGTFSVETNLP